MLFRTTILCASIFSLVECVLDRQYKTYENVEVIAQAGGFVRGWFPEWFPDGAVDIHEARDLDTNRQAISFRIVDNDTLRWPAHCKESIEPMRPSLRTKLFPRRIQDLEGIQSCGHFFMVKDTIGLLHRSSITLAIGEISATSFTHPLILERRSLKIVCVSTTLVRGAQGRRDTEFN